MSIKLSRASGETLSKLQRSMRLPERPPLLRLAFAKGLIGCGGQLPEKQDSRGPEIPLKVIVRGDELLLDGLMAEAVAQRPDGAEKRRQGYKCIVDFGLLLMRQEYEQVDDNSDYLIELLRATARSMYSI